MDAWKHFERTKGKNIVSLEEAVQAYWQRKKNWQAKNGSSKPAYYILDMFPYPSGSSLHVGHLLGYFATCSLSIYYRMLGYEVLHPMGFDAFGLPAEQYAIETGQHPAVTTAYNIAQYKKLLRRSGLTFDWEREVSTCDPAYYRWTQQIFRFFFDSWYDKKQDRARPIEELQAIFAQEGNKHCSPRTEEEVPLFTAESWQKMSSKEQNNILLSYRLAYLSYTMVNWCPKLGTVLANEEVKDGFSERGGYPVERKKMRQWQLCSRFFADRLLQELDHLDWPDSVKEMQRNWIGKSYGANILFEGVDAFQPTLEVFSTRPDTLYGVTYMVLAPEHPMVEWLLEQQRLTKQRAYRATQAYVEQAVCRSERLRLQEGHKPSGVDTGYQVVHPMTKEKIPVWIADYVLPGYGTGAIMAVPAHDERDYLFAQHFGLPIVPVIEGEEQEEGAYMLKEGKMINSGPLNGLSVKDAMHRIIVLLEEKKIGTRRICYKMRDPIFSRQRYWGEPFPVYYQEEQPYLLSEASLPLCLPEIDAYKPSQTGQPPLSRAKEWHTEAGYPLELNTMPGWAGSSWYFLRYMDPHNTQKIATSKAMDYWGQVDFYMGGAEHATGHLLYARLFTHWLCDLGHVPMREPFKKLVNQGMIQGVSSFVYRIKGTQTYVSAGKKEAYETTRHYVKTTLVDRRNLDLEGFKRWRKDLKDATFILEEDGTYLCDQEVEKMSKSKHNTIDPNDIMAIYGADTLRLHLLFLGPITQSKPWNTRGIDGCHRFLNKVWQLFFVQEQWQVKEEKAPEAMQRVLHQAIKQVRQDIERHSLNTCISALMICVNHLTQLKCHYKEILQPLVQLLAPFAPHMAEYLWQRLGATASVAYSPFPEVDESYLVQERITYPVAINGKVRAQLEVGTDVGVEEIKTLALAHNDIAKRLQNTPPKKVIVVPQRMVNVVI